MQYYASLIVPRDLAKEAESDAAARDTLERMLLDQARRYADADGRTLDESTVTYSIQESAVTMGGLPPDAVYAVVRVMAAE